jgi:hypothetical protein
MGSAALSVRSYEEVEADRSANWQAVVVVILSSLGAAVGVRVVSPFDVTILLIVAATTWVSWVLLTLLIGTQFLPGNQTKADFGQIFRTTGFSSSPGILRVFGFLPYVGGLIFTAATLWMLVSFVVAIRQALDYTSTSRAFLVCVLGWLVHTFVFFGFLLTAY